MVKETWAILDQYSSTVGQPKHDKYRKRQNSQCPYQRDISGGQRTYKPAKWLLTKALGQVYNNNQENFISDQFYLQGHECFVCKTPEKV